MEKKILGRTGLAVTELCFGVLPMGPLQLNLPVEEGASLLRQAIEEGVNFLDTAEGYRTYPHIAEALRHLDSEVVIATKSFAKTYEKMEKSIQTALKEMDREYIDIFHLHAAFEDGAVFEERAGALECLVDYKTKGLVRFIGISTHSVAAVRAAAQKEEIDVIFPLINKIGMGILHGGLDEMLRAIEEASQAGKGLYAMKALAGGHLLREAEEAIGYVRAIPAVSSVAVGMVRPTELEMNLRIFRNEPVPVDLKTASQKSKKLFVSNFCEGCGACVKVCPNSALNIVEKRAVVDSSKCLLCGYCNPVCPKMALRIV